MITQAPPPPATEMTETKAAATAFALGWQMARLYTGSLSSNAQPKLHDDLPGLSDLPAGSLVALGLAQANVALTGLTGFLGTSANLPTTDPITSEAEKERPDKTVLRKAIVELHVSLLVRLTAADFRLGKAYGLGRALADTCSRARGTDAERKAALEHHLEPHRALVLVGWLDDLSTVLPAHAGHAVGDSLQRWATWGQAADLRCMQPEQVNETIRTLRRSGQRWRAIISGEKDAKDALQRGDYVAAARGTLTGAGAILRSIAKQLWAPLLLAAILIGIGIWLMFANNSTAQVIAGLGTVAGGLGVTWRSAAASAGRLSIDLGRPIWEAQLDLVIAQRLTTAPQRDYVALVPRPQGRIRRAWQELTTAGSGPQVGAGGGVAVGRPPSQHGAGEDGDASINVSQQTQADEPTSPT